MKTISSTFLKLGHDSPITGVTEERCAKVDSLGRGVRRHPLTRFAHRLFLSPEPPPPVTLSVLTVLVENTKRERVNHLLSIGPPGSKDQYVLVEVLLDGVPS